MRRCRCSTGKEVDRDRTRRDSATRSPLLGAQASGGPPSGGGLPDHGLCPDLPDRAGAVSDAACHLALRYHPLGVHPPLLRCGGIPCGGSYARRAGVRDLARRSLRWRVGPQWYFVALLGLPIATVLCASALFGLAPLNALMDKWQLLFTLVVPMLLFRVVVLNLTEEIGWMGFLQDRLQESYGPLKASVLVTIPFALWHLPSWMLDPGFTLAQLHLALAVTVLFGYLTCSPGSLCCGSTTTPIAACCWWRCSTPPLTQRSHRTGLGVSSSPASCAVDRHRRNRRGGRARRHLHSGAALVRTGAHSATGYSINANGGGPSTLFTECLELDFIHLSKREDTRVINARFQCDQREVNLQYPTDRDDTTATSPSPYSSPRSVWARGAAAGGGRDLGSGQANGQLRPYGL